MSENGRASARRIARITGLLYLIVIVCAGFSEGYVRGTLIVPGDAAATAANIIASDGLFRAGLVTDLIAFMADAAIAVLFYVLLKPVNATLALVTAAFRLVAHPAIAAINLLNHFGALLFLSGAGYLDVFTPVQLQSLALLALEAHGYGYLIGGAFFGVHLALLGHLLFRSDLFPRILGLLMAAAAIGYVTETLVFFLVPSLEGFASVLVVATASVGEVTLCLWLLIRGVRAAPARASSPA